MYHRNTKIRAGRTRLFMILIFSFYTPVAFPMQDKKEALLKNRYVDNDTRRNLTTRGKIEHWLKNKLSSCGCFEEARFSERIAKIFCEKIWPEKDFSPNTGNINPQDLVSIEYAKKQKRSFQEALTIVIYNDFKHHGTDMLFQNISISANNLEEFSSKLELLKLRTPEDNKELLENIQNFSKTYGEHDIYLGVEKYILQARESAKNIRLEEVPSIEYSAHSQIYLIEKSDEHTLQERNTLEQTPKHYFIKTPDKTHSEEIFVRRD